MKTSFLKAGVLLIVLSSTVSCTTTGDPNEGGLFRWSEEKAIQRADGLERQRQDIGGF